MKQRRHVIRYVSLAVVCFCLLSAYILQAQNSPTPTLRPIYTFFPERLNCDDAIGGIGPTTGLVTIGVTTLSEIEPLYSPYLNVSIEYFESAGETRIGFYRKDDGSPYQGVAACVIDDVIVAAENSFPSLAQAESLGLGPRTPVATPSGSWERVGIKHYVARYGIPDVITYSSNPYHRVAFWFAKGIAASFYVRYDLPGDDPLSFGAVGQTVYFPFQATTDFESRWPFNDTFPEDRFLDFYLEEGLPSERNPFDFDAIVATLEAANVTPPATPSATPAN